MMQASGSLSVTRYFDESNAVNPAFDLANEFVFLWNFPSFQETATTPLFFLNNFTRALVGVVYRIGSLSISDSALVFSRNTGVRTSKRSTGRSRALPGCEGARYKYTEKADTGCGIMDTD